LHLRPMLGREGLQTDMRSFEQARLQYHRAMVAAEGGGQQWAETGR
jgi:hypothetical protein